MMIVSVRELSSSILLYSPGTEVVSIVIWELWENGQYVELSALGVLFILALFAAGDGRAAARRTIGRANSMMHACAGTLNGTRAVAGIGAISQC